MTRRTYAMALAASLLCANAGAQERQPDPAGAALPQDEFEGIVRRALDAERSRQATPETARPQPVPTPPAPASSLPSPASTQDSPSRSVETTAPPLPRPYTPPSSEWRAMPKAPSPPGRTTTPDPDGAVQAGPRPEARGASLSGLAVVLRDVNMRSGPGTEHAPVAVVKAGTAVSVETCDGWCEIEAGGYRGWVYRSFLGSAVN